jgi:hypothetical protein
MGDQVKDDTTYEELRLRNIQRNNAILSALEINSASCLIVQPACIKSEGKQSKNTKQRFAIFLTLVSFTMHNFYLQPGRDHLGNSRIIAHCKCQV